MAADGSMQPRLTRTLGWTPAYDAVIRLWYPVNVAKCCELLPHKSKSAVRNRAGALKVRSSYVPTPPKNREQRPPDQFRDEAIRKLYLEKPTKRDVATFATTWAVPESYVKLRAMQLGIVLPRFKEPPWSEAEDALLLDNRGLTPHGIRKKLKAKGFRRSLCAIANRLYKRELRRADARSEIGIFSTSQIALGLGVTAAAVFRWIAVGRLKATQRNDPELTVKAWDVTARDLVDYLSRHWTSFDMRKADAEWMFGTVMIHVLNPLT